MKDILKDKPEKKMEGEDLVMTKMDVKPNTHKIELREKFREMSRDKGQKRSMDRQDSL